MGIGSFPEVKRPGRGVDHPSHLAPRLKEEHRYTSAPPLALRGSVLGCLLPKPAAFIRASFRDYFSVFCPDGDYQSLVAQDYVSNRKHCFLFRLILRDHFTPYDFKAFPIPQVIMIYETPSDMRSAVICC